MSAAPVLTLSVVLLFFMLTAGISAADDRGRKEYWLKTYGELGKTPLSERAHRVFDQVLAASDRRAGIEPELYIIEYNSRPWAQSLADGSIIITKNALDFCYRNTSAERGDSRFAFVVGHELAHQFNGDFWHYRFLRTANDESRSMQAFQDVEDIAKNPDMLLAKELQADQYGIIYATLAGYSSDEIVHRDRNFFLEWAENETPAGTPSESLVSLSRRREAAVTMRLQEVAERMALFQLGVISYYLGRYHDALTLLQRFASHFPGREVYANIGTVYLRMAYDLLKSSETGESFPYSLYFALDINTRAESISVPGRVKRGSSKDRDSEYRELLNDAVENLKRAVEFDPQYEEAKNSLGCALILSNKYYEAVSTLEEALRPEPEQYMIRNNLAVAYILLSKEVESSFLKSEAEKILTLLSEKDAAAKHNLMTLQQAAGKESARSSVRHPVQQPARDYEISGEAPLELKAGSVLSGNGRWTVVEEMSGENRHLLRVLKLPGDDIFIVARDDRVALILHKSPSSIRADVQPDSMTKVYISRGARRGIMYSNNQDMDYFEF